MDNRRIHSVERDDRGIDRGKLNSKLYSTFDYKKLLDNWVMQPYLKKIILKVSLSPTTF